jgi:hypothetical protein
MTVEKVTHLNAHRDYAWFISRPTQDGDGEILVLGVDNDNQLSFFSRRKGVPGEIFTFSYKEVAEFELQGAMEFAEGLEGCSIEYLFCDFKDECMFITGY